jgi:flavodoxin
MKRTGISLLILAALASACTAPEQKLTPADLRITRPGARSLVVVHSRSGNTAVMGLRISEKMNSDYIRLRTPEKAGKNYLHAPNRKDDAPVEPKTVDLAKYDVVFLGSPIWYWHPTAFICSFIRSNDFSGKKVVLYFTYEGGLSKTAVDEWKSLVEGRGGTVIDVVSINRKIHKMPDSLRAETESIIDKNKPAWIVPAVK